MNLPKRIIKLRKEFFKIKPSISLARAEAFTKVAKSNPGLPAVLLKAKGFYKACETIPIYIGDGELITGHPGGKPRAGIFSPEIAWSWLKREINTVHKRDQDPYFLNENDKKTLLKEIFPFWQGKSVEESINKQLDEISILPLTVKSGIIDCEVKSTSGGGDLSPGYENILFKKGFLGIKQTAEDNLKKLKKSNPENIEKFFFLKAVCIVCDGMILLGKRYRKLAEKLLKSEENTKRKLELTRIAEVFKRIPKHPPVNFHEALQMIWCGQIGLFLEENTSGSSPGRIDQYLYPFFKKDLENNILSKDELLELLYCFLIKFNEIPWLLSEFAAHYFAGYIPFQNIVCGGQTKSGKDATNELSYIILDCVKNLKMYQPSLAVRVHNKTPFLFLKKITEVISEGIGFPAIHFDDTTIKMLLSSGISLEDARNYCLMGCVEPYVHGKLSRWSSACYTNYPIAIELALNNGIHLKTGELLGLQTGDPKKFKTFDDFEQAVKKQLDYLIEISAIATIIAQKAHKKLLPKPLSSSLVEGCIDSAKDITAGGAFYNTGPGVIFIGTADYANSMIAIKKLVFESKSISMSEMCLALKNNFTGYEEIHLRCLDAPKYGNDIDEVDDLAADIIDYSSKTLNKFNGLYSKLELGTLSVTTNIPQGLVISALPSGRKAGTPLADGISPAQGTDIHGPTAAIKSVDKINQENSSVGTLFNMKITPELLSDENGQSNFIALIRTHNQLGGAQIQFNCIEPEKLKDAQINPEKYRSLMVRVSGYSAYFTELCKEVQDDIIKRSTHRKWCL